MKYSNTYKWLGIVFFIALLSVKNNHAFAQLRSGNDTMLTGAVIYLGDTIEAKTLAGVWLFHKLSADEMAARAQWTRLRNAIYVTFPYAKRAGKVLNDVNAHLTTVSNEGERKKYIKSRERELKKEFTDPLMNLSVYQGKVLMKLINRETGNNCYEIIKEYKGGLVARFYQTVAFFFSSSLKQPYDKNSEDALMERIVQEVERMYGYRS